MAGHFAVSHTESVDAKISKLANLAMKDTKPAARCVSPRYIKQNDNTDIDSPDLSCEAANLVTGDNSNSR